MDKFGQVYLCQSSTVTQVKSACFSNRDWKWYNQVGNIHCEYNSYRNAKTSIGFTLENRNKKGEIEKYQVRVILPFTLHQLPDGPSMEYLELAKSREMNAAREWKLLDALDTQELETFSKFCGFSAFICPSEKLVEKSDLLPYCRMGAAIDDAMDEDGDDDDTYKLSNLLRTMSYAKGNTIFNEATSEIRNTSRSYGNKMVAMSEISSVLRSSKMGTYGALTLQKYSTCMLEMAKRVKEVSLALVESPEDIEPFMKCVEQGLDSIHLETCLEWQSKKDHVLFAPAQEDLKRITAAGAFLVEAVALQRQIRIRPEIRESFIFQWFCKDAANFAGKLNDILSYSKETVENKAAPLNQIYILHNLQDMDLSRAFEKVNEEANKSIERLIACGEMLKSFYDFNSDLVKYIEVTKEVICGSMQAAFYLDRYHKNLKVDCYVSVD